METKVGIDFADVIRGSAKLDFVLPKWKGEVPNVSDVFNKWRDVARNDRLNIRKQIAIVGKYFLNFFSLHHP
jgi:hypothetical protein